MLISLVAAVSMMVVLTAAVSASSPIAKWSGVGQVLYAGPSPDPAAPTMTESEFKFRRDGSIKRVNIKTSNELFLGVLGDGAGGSAITECKDRKHSTACEDLDALLSGAQLISFHNSEATLRNVSQETFPVPGLGDIEVLHGQLRGKLAGEFSLNNGTGEAVGTAQLRIKKGSIASYACFALSPAGPVPLASLQTCTDGSGGQLFPIFLEVQDKGNFEIGAGTGSMADLLSLKGKVEVNATANLLTQQFGGTVVIPKAKAYVEDDEGEADEDEGEEDED